MAGDSVDPVLDAKTVAQLMAALDAAYGLDLPTSFPPSTQLALIWAAGIAVTKDPSPGVLYQATGTAPLPITVPAGTVSVSVVGTAETPHNRRSNDD